MTDQDSDSQADTVSTSSSVILLTDDSELSGYTSDDDPIEDRIYLADEHFIDEPKTDGRYYLGKAHFGVEGKYMLLDLAISARTFFRFRYADVIKYLNLYSSFNPWRVIQPNVMDVLQLHIVHHAYYVVVKTHWIRLVQRHWKRVYQERRRMMARRCTLVNLRCLERTGRHLPDCRHPPQLYGMMSVYGRRGHGCGLNATSTNT